MKNPFATNRTLLATNSLNATQPVINQSNYQQKFHTHKMTFGITPQTQQFPKNFDSNLNRNMNSYETNLMQTFHPRPMTPFYDKTSNILNSGKQNHIEEKFKQYKVTSYDQSKSNISYNNSAFLKESRQRYEVQKQPQFMNIDSMSMDIQNLLSSQKNKQDLYKILGIQLKGEQTGLNNYSKVNDFKSSSPQPINFTKTKEVKSYSPQPQIYRNTFNNNNLSYQKRQSQHYFGKKNEAIKDYQNYEEKTKRAITMQESYKENYGIAANQHQQYLNSISPKYQEKNYQVNKIENYPSGKIQKQGDVQNYVISDQMSQLNTNNFLEIFKHSNFGNDVNLSLNIEQALKEQIIALTTEGKSRIFLTAHEKIKVFPYNLQMI